MVVTYSGRKGLIIPQYRGSEPMKPSLRAGFVEKEIQETVEKVAVYGRRHATGVIRDENKKTAAKLSESILPELPEGHAEQLEALKKAEEILQAHYAKTVKQLNKKKGETT